MKLVIRVGCCFLSLIILTLSALAQSETIRISTVAGNGTSRYIGVSGEGPATGAHLNYPLDVAVDSAGNLYISDSSADRDNQRVRKVTRGGLITIGLAPLEYPPTGVALDAAGNLYIVDSENHIVVKVTTGGVFSTVAGTDRGVFGGVSGFGGDGGPATSALLNRPTYIAVDAAGNLYIADFRNQRVRKVTPDRLITTVAGNGELGFSGDGGPATSAQLNSPTGVAVDAAGNLYIADSLNQRVRKVTPDGLINTVAGNGALGFSGDGGPATSAQLNSPEGIAVDSAGNLYIVDSFNQRVRKVSPSGVISTVAGNGASGFSGDGGPATSAQLNDPKGIAVDDAGNLYVADTGNHRIRKVGSRRVKAFEPSGSKRDFNGDGKIDVLWRDITGSVSMWLMDGYTFATNSLIANVSATWTIVESGDFNGDGKADILWRDTGGNMSIWLMDGISITGYDYPGNMPMTWAIAGVADFNGDGKADILWRDTLGNVLMWFMNGPTIANYNFIGNVWAGWTIVGSGDFNGDGKADILWRDTAGDVSIWLMDDGIITSYGKPENMPTTSTIAAIGDFNGNGTADILWRDITGDVSIWLMNGHTISNNSFIANVWPGWTIVGSGDFNGDRKADILWRDAIGNVSMWLMDGDVIAGYRDVGNVSDRMAQ
jgi:sugar lactone lactonase YvrE